VHKVHVSVRHLVEFILRSGSINSGFFISSKRALEGTRIHQRIQRERKKEAEESGAVYKKELQLRTEYIYKDICFCIEGRVDGIFILNNSVTIEEIKSTLLPLSQIDKDVDHWHWAQAKCYAFIYALQQNLNEISCALIYSHVETEEQITFTEIFSFDALEAFVLGLIAKYWDFAKMDADRQEIARETGMKLDFPFNAYRGGQREMAVAVYAAVKNKKKLFSQAPTGIGKTMATLFSAVKAIAAGMGDKIFYLTSKTVQRHLAETALNQMADKGLRMRSITLTAKDKICFNTERACNPQFCKYADGHFDRVNTAILDCITNECLINRITVEDYAKKHTVCPSEFALDLADFCHIVIGDYNHAYDPKAKLKRFFQDGGDYIILLDEAHNLVDRGREMFSASLHRNEFAKLRKNLSAKHPLYKILGKVVTIIRSYKTKDDVTAVLQNLSAACELWFKDNPADGDEILPVYFAAMDFLRVAELYDERYTTMQAENFIKLFCLDPSYLLGVEQKKSRTSIFFSATLTPLPYFQGILGGSEEDFLLRLGSPFPRENLCLVVDGNISTKYNNRQHSLDTIAQRLHIMVQAKPGNYMAFFPSYAYLNQVYDMYTANYGDAIKQEQGVDNDFLSKFDKDSAVLGFVVLGGAFSEGIDLKGERLIGAAVVGVGMPQLSSDRDVIAEYFTKNNKRGFNYAYLYPGMNKVLQAAGRVIRTESDKGVVMLIDERYLEYSYRSLFPAEWEGYIQLKNNLNNELENFWRNRN